MRSEFIPEVAMAAGGGGGGGGAGVGTAIAAGAMAGAMVGMEVAAHERRRGPDVVVVNTGHHRHHRK